MAVDWRPDLRDEAADAMGVAVQQFTAWEADELERCANLPADQDRILSVDTSEHFPVEIATARHLRAPRLLIWDWRVLDAARTAAREGYRVRVTTVTPASLATYVTGIERV